MAQITVSRTKQKQIVQVSQKQQVVQQQQQDVVVLEEQIVSQQQSFEMMRVLLGASVGCLAYLRSLLPDDCFVDQRYGTNTEAFLSYDRFTTEEEPSSAQIKDKAPRVKRLQRGRNKDADRLLDWLELGIFDALEKRYLKSVQFIIYLDEDKPEIIYECYTFSFAYADGEPALNIVDSRGRQVVVKHAKTDLQGIMRKIIIASQNLPPLPDRRFLTLRLYYNKGTPKDYNPPLFRRDFSKTKAYFATTETDRKETIACGQTALNYHAVGVKVSTICREGDTPSSTQADAKRQRRTFIPAEFDVEVPMLLPLEKAEVQQPQETSQFDPSQILATQPDADMMEVDVVDTIDERIAKEKQELEKMFKLELELEGEHDTQPMPESARMSTAYSSSRQESISRDFASFNLESRGRESLSSDRTSSLTPVPPDLERKRKQDEDIVNCECGSKEDQGFMLCCEKCDTWRHAVCYGYKGPTDARIPTHFTCHRCNLSRSAVEEMGKLCQFRRVLNSCWNDDFLGTAKKMAEEYDLEPIKSPAVARRLVKEGFFAQLATGADPATRDVRWGKRGPPQSYQVVKTAANQRELDRYMDPNLQPEEPNRRGNRHGTARATSRLTTATPAPQPTRPITSMRSTRSISKSMTAEPTLPNGVYQNGYPTSELTLVPTSELSSVPGLDSDKDDADADADADRFVRSSTAMSCVSTASSVMVGVPDYGQFGREESVELSGQEMESIFPRKRN